MKAFKYTFQKIVDLKGSEKTQAEWMLSEAFSQLNQLQLELEDLQNMLLSWRQKLEDAVTVPTPVQSIVVIQQYIDFYNQSITNKTEEIYGAEHIVNLRRADLASKMKEEKVWVKAKENEYTKFKHTMQLIEQNQIDEMASIRYKAPTQ